MKPPRDPKEAGRLLLRDASSRDSIRLGRADAAQQPGSSRPAEAAAAAAAGAATARTEADAAIWAGGCCHSAGRLPPDRRAASAAAGRMLPGDRGGCCPAAGQHPPRSGGCCPAAGQQPPHHSRVLHHACADASYGKKRKNTRTGTRKNGGLSRARAPTPRPAIVYHRHRISSPYIADRELTGKGSATHETRHVTQAHTRERTRPASLIHSPDQTLWPGSRVALARCRRACSRP